MRGALRIGAVVALLGVACREPAGDARPEVGSSSGTAAQADDGSAERAGTGSAAGTGEPVALPLPVEPACRLDMVATRPGEWELRYASGGPVGLALTSFPESEALDWDLEDADAYTPWLAVYPLAAGRVLATVTHEYSPDVDGVLWEVACDGSRPPRPFLDPAVWRIAALLRSRDGMAFYVATPSDGGLMRLDPSSRHVELLTAPPQVGPSCWIDGITFRDVPTAVSEDGTLRFSRGQGCGYEGDWNGYRLWLRHPDDPARRAIYQPRPVTWVWVDSRGELWVGDAGECQDEGGYTDVQSFGAVHRSGDWGMTFAALRPVDAEGSPMETATRMVETTADGRGVVVLSGICSNGGRGDWGGELFASDDGWRWARLAAPPEAASDEGSSLVLVHLPTGSLDHIVVCDGAPRCWSTADRGTTWLPAAAPDLPPDRGRRAVFGELTFTATEDGLLVESAGEPPRRAWP